MLALGYLYLICFPLIGFVLSFYKLKKNPKYWKRYIPFIIYALFIGAYVFNTQVENLDLVRYIPEIESYGKLDFFEAFQVHNDILYARDIMFWLFGTLQIPHMVPAITTATVYAVAFYLTCDTAKRYQKENLIVYIVLFQIAMIPYVTLINNIRNVFSFSLIILAVYLDVVKKKRNFFVLFCYAFGCLMHLSAFSLIIARIVCGALKHIFDFVVVLPLLFSPIIRFLYNNMALLSLGGILGTSINAIIFKLYGYLTDHSSYYAILSANSITIKIDRFIMTVGMLIAVLLVCYILHTSKNFFLDNKDIYTFIGLVALGTLSCNLFVMPNFWRFAASFYVLFGVLIIPYIAEYNKLPFLLKMIIPVYAFLGLSSFIMQIWKCTWFEFWDWALVFLTSNIFTVLFDVINGVFNV